MLADVHDARNVRVAAVAALHASARWDGLRVGADGGGTMSTTDSFCAAEVCTTRFFRLERRSGRSFPPCRSSALSPWKRDDLRSASF